MCQYRMDMLGPGGKRGGGRGKVRYF